jgi:DNA (cytosine-5)-methyltransferase 1
VCQPFLVPFYANGRADSTADPLRTVTTKDRHGLCEPDAVRLDIRFRMLQPHELAAAMGFPAGYRITGNRGEQVKQIGNAVEVNTARQLCLAMLGAS